PKIPIITTIHSDYLLDDYRGGKFVSFIFRKINAWALRKMDYYIGVSDRFKDMMISRGFGTKKSVFSVYNGLDFNKEIIIEREKEAFLSDCNVDINENMTYVGIMGRLDPVKNHGLFIEIAKKVIDKNRNFRFLIAGDGKLEEELKKLAKLYKIDKYIHFLGFVDKPYEFYNSIDINVLTSLSESFPYVMLEGARIKKPIVTTDVGGVERVVENGETGYIVENYNVDDFVRRILELKDDEDLRLAMGNRIYEIVKNRYSMDNFISEHIKIYETILGGGNTYENN
ncbi:MAG: glycosyltransferase family 4 protein, partial [Bacillota bacterium]|nr:glycosyltransferase family 4 protein [Bacillota bacterium]